MRRLDSSPLKSYTLRATPDRKGSAVFYHQGQLVTYRCPGSRDRNGGGGQRNEIGGFSPAARRRMMLLLASLRMDEMPLFITLTYPAFWAPESDVWKKHLDNFGKWMRRKFRGISAVWKLEPQKRGAPHFHLLVFGVDFISHQAVAEAWFRIVGSDDPNHLAAGTEVRKVRSKNGVMSYASKAYMGKEIAGGPQFSGVGRFWGVIGRADLPRSEKFHLSLTEEAAIRFGRTVRKRLKKRHIRSNGHSGRVFTGSPLDWVRLALFLDPGAVKRDDPAHLRCSSRSPKSEPWCTVKK